ncbi:MAG: hypothetical protein AB1726_12410 [Planctomycetota bacterium]
MLREHVFDSVLRRRLLSLDIASPAELPGLDLPAGNFACFLAWDARGDSESEQELLANGRQRRQAMRQKASERLYHRFLLSLSAEDVSALIEPLLRAGASYFVCWGPDCERVHDIIDETLSYSGNDFGVPDESCIMTTWHDSEPLREALRFFLANCWPEEHYEDSTTVALAISVGSSAWAMKIAEALDHPREFVERAAESGAT